MGINIRADDPSETYAKYSWVSSKKHGGCGPGSPVHTSVIESNHDEIRITEGVLKADIAKKTVVAPQRSRPDVVAARAKFQRRQKRMTVDDLVFVDETGCHPGIGPLRGWAYKGVPLFGPEQVSARKQHISIVGAISLEGLIAKMTVRGGIGSRDFLRFVETRLANRLLGLLLGGHGSSPEGARIHGSEL